MGFVAMGFVACDSVSGVFDKFSYDEVFEDVSETEREICSDRQYIKQGKFIPPSELTDEEKGLIGACEWTDKAPIANIFEIANGRDQHYKNKAFEKEKCKTGQSERKHGLYKVDKKSGAFLLENKYKVITIVESAEYGVDKRGQGFCKKREIYKLKRGQPKE